MRQIINVGNELWNERCTIINLERTGNDEQMYRTKMYEFSLKMKQHRDKLNPRDYHLVQRNRKYFFNTDRVNIEMWQVRLKAAISSELQRRQSCKDSIEAFVIRKKPRKKKRAYPTESKTQKRYRQSTLFQSSISKDRNTTELVQITNTSIISEEIREKRKRLYELVKKRRKKKRKQTLIHPLRTVLPKVPHQSSQSPSPGKKRMALQVLKDKGKKRKLSSQGKARKISIREKSRKLTGQDLKNNR